MMIPQKLLEFGFEQDNSINAGIYILKRDLDNSDFYVRIEISESEITAQAFEKETDERYTLLDVVSANGAFVGQLREKIRKLMEEIQATCFENTDICQKYVDYIKANFGAEQEYPWEDEASVFRCPNGKWFGLLMRIGLKKLGINSLAVLVFVPLKAMCSRKCEMPFSESVSFSIPAFTVTAALTVYISFVIKTILRPLSKVTIFFCIIYPFFYFLIHILI